MPNPADWSSLRSIPVPGRGESAEFRYADQQYRLTGAKDSWTLERLDDARRLGLLRRAGNRWALVPCEGDGEWNASTHLLAIETFLDDNDAWEEDLRSEVHSDGAIKRYVRGSARGARVAGTSLGVLFGGIATIAIVASGGDWGTSWPIFLLPAFMVVRPWFLGVYLTSDGIEVRSWLRFYRLPSASVSVVELAPVYSALLGAGTTWIPFVGSVRMMQIETATRRLPLSLPCTMGRRSHVLTLVREVRAHLGASPEIDFTL